jgi:nitrite reductase/ring-hydroxylating ferredoxin subunit
MSYIGLGGSQPAACPPEKTPVRALPSNWYTSEEMYQLERRAIFSRRWLLLTHKSRLPNSGDYLRYSVANYDIIVSKDRAGEIHTFHNVCRHRAYPVVESDAGNAKIFSCRYHGWSYGLNGNLAKAPGYQELPTFEKAKNGLFPIHTRIDRNGFLWINMDSKKEPEVSWESQFDTFSIIPGTWRASTTGRSSPTTSTSAIIAKQPIRTFLPLPTSRPTMSTAPLITSNTTRRLRTSNVLLAWTFVLHICSPTFPLLLRKSEILHISSTQLLTTSTGSTS